MTRFSLLTALLLFTAHSALGAEKNYVEMQLLKDKINLSSSLKTASNPLKFELRPKLSPFSTDYEYHAWGEKNANDEYPLYKWEQVTNSGEAHNYELARYWIKLTPEKKEFIEKNKNIVGSLTHKNLRARIENEYFLNFTRNPELQKEAPLSCVPVPGKPGFVFSPTEKDQLGNQLVIDVRGFNPGQLAKDPFSGKIIRIP